MLALTDTQAAALAELRTQAADIVNAADELAASETSAEAVRAVLDLESKVRHLKGAYYGFTATVKEED